MKRAIVFFTAVFISIMLWKCASQTMPNGGPKDKTPPILQKSIPQNGATSFTNQQIELTFDELVKLNNPNEEIIISPTPPKGMKYTAKANKILIETKTPWKDSTTYSIAFQSAIQDVNEGNPAKNIRLAFSTGPHLDTLTISGTISQPLTETIPDKVTVALYQQDTFNIFKHVPDLFTKSNKEGKFRLSNLKPGNYRIYAFDDKNKNLKVESQSEKFALLPDTLHLKKNIDSLNLPIFLIDSRPLKLTSIRNTGKTTTLRFNKNIIQYQLTLDTLPSTKLLSTYADNQTEITLYNPPLTSDSVRFALTAHDTLMFTVDTTFYLKTITTKVPAEPFRAVFEDGKADLENGDFELTAQLNKPISRINFDSTYIRIDSLDSIFFSPEDIKFDTLKKKLTIKKKLNKKVLTKPKLPAPPNIHIAKGFLISIQSDTSRADIKAINFTREDQTGTLFITIQTKEKSYIIELLTSNNKLIGSFRNTKDYTFKKLPAQDYKMRAIIDSNTNGIWDPQNVYKNQPPEKVIFYRGTDKKTAFPVRAGWELGPLIFKF